MDIEENEGGGKTVTIYFSDNLRKVPRSHRHLVTPRILEVFADPPAYFRDVVDRCPFEQMAEWLDQLISDDAWVLELHKGFQDFESAGFFWISEKVRVATISLPVDIDLSSFPASLQSYYSLVDEVRWMPFACAGGLFGAENHIPFNQWAFDYYGAKVDPERSFIWGFSPCGDMLIYTPDDRGGWLNHESHQVHLIGSITETINWVYSELLTNRCPEWDQDWNRKRR
jgi:hypothetical protein